MNKESMKFAFGLLAAVLFVAGILSSFDDFSSSRGVVFMLAAMVCQNWKRELK